MIIKNMMWQLEDATLPILKSIKTGDTFKSMAIGLKKGLLWEDYKAVMPTKIIVIQGKVLYKQGEIQIELKKFADLDIPVNSIHSLEAMQDSICILIQG